MKHTCTHSFFYADAACARTLLVWMKAHPLLSQAPVQSTTCIARLKTSVMGITFMHSLQQLSRNLIFLCVFQTLFFNLKISKQTSKPKDMLVLMWVETAWIIVHGPLISPKKCVLWIHLGEHLSLGSLRKQDLRKEGDVCGLFGKHSHQEQEVKSHQKRWEAIQYKVCYQPGP